MLEISPGPNGYGGCSGMHTGDSAPKAIRGQGYQLVFNENFDTLDANLTGTRDDTSRWQAVWFRSAPPSGSVFVQNSVLHIQSTSANSYPKVGICTRRLTQAGSTAFQHGYFEASMKVTSGNGAWPSFWSKSLARAFSGTTPPCAAELDFFEGQGNQLTTFYGTNHYDTDATAPADQQNANNAHTVANYWDAWHTFACLWTSSTITWYLDDVALMSTTPYPTDGTFGTVTEQLMVLFLEMETNGFNVGNLTDGTTPATLDTQVDWVRVWQDSNGVRQ